MVQAVSSSGANVIALFSGRPTPAPPRPARAEQPFAPEKSADSAASPRPGQGARPGGPPAGLLSYQTAASLQEDTGRASAAKASTGGLSDLTPEEEAQVKDLKARDAEVRRHEQAHAAAGGQHAGSPSYSYQRGPDGRDYAIGGEVPIDASPVAGDPKATIEKMQQVKAAASAPAEPSSQDRQVAAQAEAERQKAVRQKAVRELGAQKAEEAAATRAEKSGSAEAADGGFTAFGASDFRRVGRSAATIGAAAAPAAPAAEPVSQRPTRPGRPSVLDISV